MNLRDAPVARRILRLAKQLGMIRPKDLADRGLPTGYIWHLERAGLLVRLDRGLYACPGTLESEHQSLLEVARRVPDGIICLLSALSFHELTQQYAHEVWVAVPRGHHHARMENLQVRYVHMSGPSLTEGIERHRIQGVELKVYTPAKTVADCFKFRSRLGMETVLQALRQGLEEQRFSPAELDRFACIDRVDRVMRPYLEVLLA